MERRLAYMKQMEQEIEERISAMTEEERDALRMLVLACVRCYDKDTTDCAVLMFGTREMPINMKAVARLNCTEMEAAQLMNSTSEMFNYANTKDAPPKDMFN
jgi:hypothetical protein